MFRSIQTKILFAIIVTTMVSLVVIGYLSVFTAQQYAHQQMEARLQSQAELMAEVVAVQYERDHQVPDQVTLTKLFTQEQLAGSALLAPDGKAVGYTDEEAPYDFLHTGSAQDVYKNQKHYVSGVAEVTGMEPGRQWYLVSERTFHQAYGRLNNLATIVIALIVLAAIVLWVLGKRMSFAVQRPIKRLSLDAANIAEGDISSGIQVAENNELKVIADSFNIMLNRLKDTMQQMLEVSGEAASMHDIMEYVDKTYDELPSGILSINNVGEITTFNQAAEEMTGLDAAEVIGLNINNPTPPGIRNLITQMIRCLSRGSLQLKTLGDIHHVSGQRVPIEYSISIQFGASNQVLGVICLFRRIQDINRFEASAQRSRSLSQLGEVSANLAHEIKNPLASIRGNTQLVKMDMEAAKMDTEEVDIVLHEVDRLSDMLDQLLHFARPEPPKTQLTDIRTIMDYVLRLMRNDLPESIHVRREYEPVPPVAIDPAQFEPMLLNLFLNAVQAMPEGGDLILRTRYQAERNMVCIEVRDTGVGIPQELSEKIFTPFFTTKEHGTGLGLPLCSQTVRAHKGIMEVESIEGEMTTFRILLQGHPEASGDNEGNTSGGIS